MYKVHLLDLVVEKCSVSRRRLLLVSIKATNKEIVNSYATGLKQQVSFMSCATCKGRCSLHITTCTAQPPSARYAVPNTNAQTNTCLLAHTNMHDVYFMLQVCGCCICDAFDWLSLHAPLCHVAFKFFNGWSCASLLSMTMCREKNSSRWWPSFHCRMYFVGFYTHTNTHTFYLKKFNVM